MDVGVVGVVGGVVVVVFVVVGVVSSMSILIILFSSHCLFVVTLVSFPSLLGNAHAAGYGQHTNGKEVRYTFDFTKAAGHWMIEVHGKV
jgi:hypothetical protein